MANKPRLEFQLETSCCSQDKLLKQTRRDKWKQITTQKGKYHLGKQVKNKKRTKEKDKLQKYP